MRALRWRLVDGAALTHRAGQWWNLTLPVGDEHLRRAYSLATAPDPAQPSTFEIAVTRVDAGQASIVLHELQVGARVQGDGPHGFFTREATRDQPALLVGTGTGVAPLRAMLEDELRHDGPALTLLFGCRTEGDILYREDFERWAAEHPRFRFEVTLSQGADGWAGRRGYVQAHLPELVEAMMRPHVYVCGLQKMIREVRRVLKQDLGYDRRMIHGERYD